MGDALMVLAMLVWLMASVGPWWVGLAIFGSGWLLNLLDEKLGL